MQRKLGAIEKLLASVPLFASLDDKGLRRIARGAVEIDAARGTTLFTPGAACDGLHAVITGRVKLALPQPGNSEKVIALVGPRRTFGETAMFLDEPHTISAETLSPSKLVRVTKSAMIACIRRNPDFACHIVASLSRRLRELIREIETSTSHSGTQRVADFLLSELPEAKQRGAAAVTLPAKKRIIASRLNVTHEHFSRILHELAASGVIAITGREIRINDVDKLRSVAR